MNRTKFLSRDPQSFGLFPPHDMEKNFDFLKICRTCMRPLTDNEFNFVDQSMYEMIKASTGLMMNNQDKLPQHICGMCLKTLHFTYAFRLECHKVDALLKSCTKEKEMSVNKKSTTNFVYPDHFKSKVCVVRMQRHPTIKKNEVKLEKLNKQPISTFEDLFPNVRSDRVQDSLEVVDDPLENEDIAEELAEMNYSQEKDQHFFSCKICSWKCKIYCEIINHYVIRHVKQSAPLKCPLCGEKVKYRNNLRSHITIHIKRAYPCRYCGIQYQEGFTMRRHLLCHTIKRSYSCNQCNMTFTQKISLDAHLEMHKAMEKAKLAFLGKLYDSDV